MRLFLALALPAEVRDRVEEAVSRMRPALPGWRFSRIEQVHLTLRFLGETDPDHLEQQRRAWSAAAATVPPIRLALTSPSAFPSARRARVLWLGVRETGSGGALARLHRELEQRARGLGFEADERAFRPHLTLARARTPRRLPPLEPYAPQAAVFEADAVRLYRSYLEPGGARHEELSAFPLAASGGCLDGDGVST